MQVSQGRKTAVRNIIWEANTDLTRLDKFNLPLCVAKLIPITREDILTLDENSPHKAEYAKWLLSFSPHVVTQGLSQEKVIELETKLFEIAYENMTSKHVHNRKEWSTLISRYNSQCMSALCVRKLNQLIHPERCYDHGLAVFHKFHQGHVGETLDRPSLEALIRGLDSNDQDTKLYCAFGICCLGVSFVRERLAITQNALDIVLLNNKLKEVLESNVKCQTALNEFYSDSIVARCAARWSPSMYITYRLESLGNPLPEKATEVGSEEEPSEVGSEEEPFSKLELTLCGIVAQQGHRGAFSVLYPALGKALRRSLRHLNKLEAKIDTKAIRACFREDTELGKLWSAVKVLSGKFTIWEVLSPLTELYSLSREESPRWNLTESESQQLLQSISGQIKGITTSSERKGFMTRFSNMLSVWWTSVKLFGVSRIIDMTSSQHAQCEQYLLRQQMTMADLIPSIKGPINHLERLQKIQQQVMLQISQQHSVP